MDQTVVRGIQFVEVESVEFLFRHRQRGATGAVDTEGFAGAQGQDVGAGIVLRQLQIPAPSVAAVDRVERAV